MPILTPLDLIARVVFLGANPDRAGGLESRALDQAILTLEGMEGEAHSGLTRPSCVRMRGQYPKGAEIRNVRQITVLSAEELAEIGAAMGLGEPVKPDWIGGNIVLEGLPRLTEIPSGTRLVFESGAGLVVDLENAPCRFAADAIEARRPGLGKRFVSRARGRRGVTAWVERPGAIALGDRCKPHVPPRRAWPPEDAAW